MKWQRVPIGLHVSDVQMWQPTIEAPNDDITYIDIASVDRESKIISNPSRVIGSQAPSRARQLVKGGDVLVSTVRPNLNAVALVSESLSGSTSSTGFSVLRAKPDSLDHRYLFRWVSNPLFVDQMVKLATGAAYPAVSDAILKSSTIPLPPLAEQQRIAAILDHADALRAKRRAAIAKLDSLSQSIFFDMFRDQNAENSVVSLAEVTDYQTGYAFSSLEYVPINANAVRLCRGANVLPGRIDWNDTVWWPKENIGTLGQFALCENDVVIAMDRPWISEGFKVAKISSSDLPSLLVQRVTRLRQTKRALSSFLYFLVRSPAFSRHCKPTETTVPHISPLDIKSFRFSLPTIGHQNKFDKRIQCINRQSLAQKKAELLIDQMFASLQHRAFQGEL